MVQDVYRTPGAAVVILSTIRRLVLRPYCRSRQDAGSALPWRI